MAELHGEKPGGDRCPGDGDESRGIPPCRRWQSTADAGTSWEERVRQLATCETCEGRGPARDEDAPARSDEAEELLSQVEQLVLEKKAGRQLGPDDLPAWEWLALIEWHKHEDAFARAHQMRTKAMHEVIVAQLNAQFRR